MPWFRHPLTRYGPLQTGLRAQVPIELECSPSRWVLESNAVIDTGSAVCLFSATWARANGLPLPPASRIISLNTAGGRTINRVYDLTVNVRFERMPEVPFSLAVVFSDAHPPGRPALIGLYNFLAYWRVTFDGSYEPAAPAGHMRFETL